MADTQKKLGWVEDKKKLIRNMDFENRSIEDMRKDCEELRKVVIVLAEIIQQEKDMFFNKYKIENEEWVK